MIIQDCSSVMLVRQVCAPQNALNATLSMNDFFGTSQLAHGDLNV